ncbi:MAG: anaerobic ribonucleoside-triphosphate reductase activating protein [bacterium]
MTPLPDETSVYRFLQRPSLVDFPGRLAAVFFTSGCNFACGFCHNAGLLQRKQKGLSAERLRHAVRRFRTRDWVDGAVITGGEPTLCDDLPAIIEMLRGEGLAVKLDTNGSRPEILRNLLPRVDCVAMDVKCSLQTYPKLAGFNSAETVKESIALIMAADCEHEFRTTVIESVHSDEEMSAVGDLIRGARSYTLQPFIPRDDLPDPLLRAVPRTTPDRMKQLQTLMTPYAESVTIKGA